MVIPSSCLDDIECARLAPKYYMYMVKVFIISSRRKTGGERESEKNLNEWKDEEASKVKLNERVKASETENSLSTHWILRRGAIQISTHPK